MITKQTRELIDLLVNESIYMLRVKPLGKDGAVSIDIIRNGDRESMEEYVWLMRNRTVTEKEIYGILRDSAMEDTIYTKAVSGIDGVSSEDLVEAAISVMTLKAANDVCVTDRRSPGNVILTGYRKLRVPANMRVFYSDDFPSDEVLVVFGGDKFDKPLQVTEGGRLKKVMTSAVLKIVD